MIKKIVLLFAFSSLLLTACKKNDFLDVNKNENNPTEVPPTVQLPYTEIGVGFMTGNNLQRIASMLMQYNAGTSNQALGYDVYNLDGGIDDQWSFEVYQTIGNLRDLIKKTQSTSPAYSGIAKILMAYSFSVATDLWGDVPYSQAGLGLDYPLPRFDKQQDIYQGNTSLGIQSIFDLVKEGIADLGKTSVLTPAGDDIIYNGSLNNWKKAGNTLLLRLAIHISNVNPTLAKQVISDVLAGNSYITNNAEDFEVPFGSNVGNQSPIYSFNNVNRPSDMMLSTRFLNLETSLNDLTRLSKLYTKPTGNFVSFDNGSTATPPATANRSKYSSYVTGPDASGRYLVRILSNSERAFILAEAALILGTAGDPNTLYQEGIRQNMLKVGMTTAEVDAYFAANPTIVNLSGSTENKRQQIITQKYISLVVNPLEAYNDYRRTGYPPLQVALNAAGDDPSVIPKRYPYPTGEQSRNPNAPNPRPKTNVKVWWGL